MTNKMVMHDGRRPVMKAGKYRLNYIGPGIMAAEGGHISDDFPGFYWRWRIVGIGWTGFKRRRVCDDPAYAPIISYARRDDPPGLAMLRAIVEKPLRVGVLA